MQGDVSNKGERMEPGTRIDVNRHAIGTRYLGGSNWNPVPWWFGGVLSSGLHWLGRSFRDVGCLALPIEKEPLQRPVIQRYVTQDKILVRGAEMFKTGILARPYHIITTCSILASYDEPTVHNRESRYQLGTGILGTILRKLERRCGHPPFIGGFTLWLRMG